MVDFRNFRWTLAAVIFLVVCVQWTFCRAVYTGRGEDAVHYQNRLVLPSHKHIRSLKAPDPVVVEKVKRGIKRSMKGRRHDQSNERNIWTSHPKNEEWSGPDTDEVAQVINSLDI